MYYYSNGIVSVITDAHITIMMALPLCQWWQIHTLLFWCHWHCVSETDTHITILLALCQWWQIHILLFWWHWHCVSETDTHITILMALTLCQWWQIHILLFWRHWHCVHDNRYIDYYFDRYFMPKIYWSEQNFTGPTKKIWKERSDGTILTMINCSDI